MKQEFTYWIYARARGGQVIYELSDLEWMTEEYKRDRVLIGKHTVTHDIPDSADTLPALIAGLEAKKKEMHATATAAIAEVEGQIQSLLAIEHKQESAA